MVHTLLDTRPDQVSRRLPLELSLGQLLLTINVTRLVPNGARRDDGDLPEHLGLAGEQRAAGFEWAKDESGLPSGPNDRRFLESSPARIFADTPSANGRRRFFNHVIV